MVTIDSNVDQHSFILCCFCSGNTMRQRNDDLLSQTPTNTTTKRSAKIKYMVKKEKICNFYYKYRVRCLHIFQYEIFVVLVVTKKLSSLRQINHSYYIRYIFCYISTPCCNNDNTKYYCWPKKIHITVLLCVRKDNHICC